MPPATPAPPGDWLTTFVPFTLLHLLSVVAIGGQMIGACWIGHRCRETPREARFRQAWGWLVLAYALGYTTWYLLPARFDWADSLPLQLCDLAMFVAALAMITGRRPFRTLLYFWGIGLSTQAFFTPIIRTGIASSHFWLFWIGHTMIVGSAVYDLVVRRYRPGPRDLLLAIGVSFVYCASVFGLDILLTEVVGRPINYGYVGPTAPANPTIIDRLGPWPGRVGILVAIVLLDYALLYAVWALARRLRPRTPGIAPGA
jgi:hypothetical integral membrane protein (TIGR02206 family)